MEARFYGRESIGGDEFMEEILYKYFLTFKSESLSQKPFSIRPSSTE